MDEDATFADIERAAFDALQSAFADIVSQVLEQIDDALLEWADQERYRSNQKTTVTIPALVGEVEVTRRRYLDQATGDWVYLLDEHLELNPEHRASPGLIDLVSRWAIKGVSFRDARDRLADLYDGQVLSHETIRQLVDHVARQVRVREEDKRLEADGQRQKPVLFVEADGLSASLQRSFKDRHEVKLGVAHEGWRRRHPSSSEFELKEKFLWATTEDSEVFWETFSQRLHARYDLRDTVVVINGDRAKWIRKGRSWFSRAIYTYDTYHLKKRLKELLRHQPARRRQALTAADNGAPEALYAAVARAEAQEDDGDLQEKLTALRRFLKREPGSIKDYRDRLQAMGIDTDGFRGMGAAEGNISTFTDRLKGRRRSWSRRGLGAMAKGLKALFTGELGACTRRALSTVPAVDFSSVEATASDWIRCEPTRDGTGLTSGRLARRQATGAGHRSGRWRRNLSRIRPTV